jgi:enamine deaminase RidA (YjgF/YER057c/UK114 family)
MTAAARLADLGLVLPPVPAPAAAYQPYVRHGDLVLTAGQLPMVDGALPKTGKVCAELTTEEGAALAKRAALNLLAIADQVADGDLERVRVLKLTVFVASVPGFSEQHLVANGASDLLGEVLGEAGVHARSAVGVPVLPLDSPVEVEAILALDA